MMSEEPKRFVCSGMLTDAKEGVVWTFDLNNDRLLLAPTQPKTDENRERYNLSALRIIKVLSEFDPDLKLEKFSEAEKETT